MDFTQLMKDYPERFKKKPKLTSSQKKIIFDCAREGTSMRMAADLAGIPRGYFYDIVRESYIGWYWYKFKAMGKLEVLAQLKQKDVKKYFEMIIRDEDIFDEEVTENKIHNLVQQILDKKQAGSN